MKRRAAAVGALGAVVLLGLGARAMGQGNQQQRVERGRYLVIGTGCGDCHTPWKMGPNGPEPDESRYLSGHPESIRVKAGPKVDAPWGLVGTQTFTAFAGPWGISFAANLTSDRNTGLGIWTEDMFVSAMRTGRHMGVSRPIAPPMPWAAYKNFNDEDLKSMFAYLKTVKPITNHVPDYIPPPGQ